MTEKPKYTFSLGNAYIAKLVEGVVINHQPLKPISELTFYSENPDAGKPIALHYGKAVKFSFEINDVELAMLVLCFWRVRLPFWRWN